jgi:spore maturation protein CgeB
MRIGFLSCFSAWHTETEIADYLEFEGHEVLRYHFPQTDQDKFLTIPIDLFITSLPQAFSLDFLKRIKAPKVAWYFDWIQAFGAREQQYVPKLKKFDLVLSTDGLIDLYEKNGIIRHWLPHACDMRTYHPVEKTIEADVGFIGHVYTAERKRMLNGLGRFDFRHYGNSEECWGPEYARVCNSVKVMFGDNCRNDIPNYWSDRLYLSLGCGAFLLYPRVPGIEKFFKDGEHLVLWDNERDLHEKIHYFLDRPEERDRIARAGAKEVALNHNWSVRVKEALDYIGRL